MSVELIFTIGNILLTLGLVAVFLIRSKRENNLRHVIQNQIASNHNEIQTFKEQLALQQRQVSRLTEQLHQSQNDMSTLQQVSQLQQELTEQLQNKIQLLEANSQQNPLYERAKKMLQLGADIEEVMTECELSRTEAELIVSLNNK